MTLLTIAAVYHEVLRQNIAKPLEIIGCTSSEIEEVRLSQSVATLPAVYRDFLSIMGKRAGRLFSDVKIYYPDVLHLKSYVDVDLPDEAFVFSKYDDQFMYFLTNTDLEDPEVHRYDGDNFVWQAYGKFSDLLFERIHEIR